MSSPSSMNVARLRGGPGDYEWVTICWQGWQATGNDGTPRECGEILIHSSFGSWANSWGHLGIPFDKWLTKAERGYCAEKFMGGKAYKFDGEKTVKELRNSLLKRRQDGDITKNDARSIWDYMDEFEDELTSSADLFCTGMGRCYSEANWEDVAENKYCECGPGNGARRFLQEPWERIATSLDNQFAGFWRDMWPVFVDHLKAAAASPEAQP